MGVSPQQINKIVKGKENLTLETISKLEQVLEIQLPNLPYIEWPANHPFAKSFVSDKVAEHDKSTKPDEANSDVANKDGANLYDKHATHIQSLISIGEVKVPTWHESGTNFLHKKVMYMITILVICSKPVSLSDLMQFMEYSNRNTFRNNYLSPLRRIGFVDLTNPENINDPEQKYKLTESGRAFLAGTLK